MLDGLGHDFGEVLSNKSRLQQQHLSLGWKYFEKQRVDETEQEEKHKKKRADGRKQMDIEKGRIHDQMILKYPLSSSTIMRSAALMMIHQEKDKGTKDEDSYVTLASPCESNQPEDSLSLEGSGRSEDEGMNHQHYRSENDLLDEFLPQHQSDKSSSSSCNVSKGLQNCGPRAMEVEQAAELLKQVILVPDSSLVYYVL